jgi:predicted ATPase/serine/threonine protein kinase
VTATGRRFGHYTLIGTLGAGGMGEVSLARDERLGREVALKMLPRHLAQDAESLHRFRREALTLASLNHPNIAVIHGFEEDVGGGLALVLERVEGESLAQRLRRGPMQPTEAMHVCVQIAEALEAAHERGIIHRDLKPGNVMLAPRGLVKVLDFGLAHRFAAPPPATAAMPATAAPAPSEKADTVALPAPGNGVSEDAPTAILSRPPVGLDDTIAIAPPGAPPGEDAPTMAMPVPPALAGGDGDTLAMPAASAAEPVTAGGTVTGTPGYMSPEQVRGHEQDPRTDVFAFGCVLFECLTGSRAVQGTTIIELMESVLDREVDLAQLPERTPQAIRDLLGRCLEKDTTHRLGEIRAARHQLEEVLGIRRAAALRAGEAAAIPTNLPAALTTFVGRERELAEGGRQLEGARWLTLSGMGGSGKTRLARRLAELSMEAFPDGVWFVDLTALERSERVPESLAEVAGIQEEPGVPILTTLTRAFADRRVLVVLDNCEDVLEPVARLGSALLGACASVKLLATSREPVGAPGEVVVAVAPLALPAEGAPLEPRTLAANESVRLFLERAGTAKPGFTIDATNAGAIVEICRRLDGIPLAIELAAARVRMLSLEEILRRLGDRFRLLTAGGRGAPARHQTLRATLEWSADHLSDDERVLFIRLGVFVGAWSLESAVAVAGTQWDEFEVLDALTRLVDRSLVVVTPPVAGETRYRYLETVRHFALERLAAIGEDTTLRDRHLDHFLAVAEESQIRLAGADQTRWLARLDAEHNDLLAAHAWCGGDPARAVMGLQLVGSLWRYWSARGHFELSGRTFREALDRPGAAARGMARATVLVRAAGSSLGRGDYDGARPMVEESLSICREMGDLVGEARCLGTLGAIAIFDDAIEEAERWSTESLAVYRKLGRAPGIAGALQNLGHIALRLRKLTEAHAYYEEALQILAGTGDERQIALGMAEFGRVATRMGMLEAGRIRFATALGITRRHGAPRETAYALEGVAELASVLGDHATATWVLGAATALRDSMGSPLTPAEAVDQETLLEHARGAIGRDACDRQWSAGQGVTLEDAVTRAVDWLESAPAGMEGSGIQGGT